MKRKFVTYLFSGVSALFFMLAGTGFNVIQYCCNNCEEHGINYVSQHACQDDSHNEMPQGCCKTLPNDHSLYNFQMLNTEPETTAPDKCGEDGCSVQRLMLDVFAPAFPLSIADVSFHNALFVLFDNRLFIPGSDAPVFSENPDPPGFLALFNQGRFVLCRKSVLLI